MQTTGRSIVVGKYAVYFRTLSDMMTERRRAFFGYGTHVPLPAHLQKNSSDDRKKKISEISSKDAGGGEKGIEKLQDIVEKAQTILIKSSAVFPFDLFPDTITIDRKKLTVVHRHFFNAKQTACVQHSDIKNIQAVVGPLFGSLTVTSDHFINNIQTIKFLPKRDVLAIQQLVQGFIIANHEDIDMSEIENSKLVELLDTLGRGEAGENVMMPADINLQHPDR